MESKTHQIVCKNCWPKKPENFARSPSNIVMKDTEIKPAMIRGSRLLINMWRKPILISTYVLLAARIGSNRSHHRPDLYSIRAGRGSCSRLLLSLFSAALAVFLSATTTDKLPREDSGKSQANGRRAKCRASWRRTKDSNLRPFSRSCSKLQSVSRSSFSEMPSAPLGGRESKLILSQETQIASLTSSSIYRLGWAPPLSPFQVYMRTHKHTMV